MGSGCTSCSAATQSPYGNPIPVWKSDQAPPVEGDEAERNLVFPGLSGAVVVRRICESVHSQR